MAEQSNTWHFAHGLNRGFMEELEKLAKRGWFADVLADPDLILGIRDNYLNVYWLGQSLFQIEQSGRKFSTHPKYLVNPDVKKAVRFDGSSFTIDESKLLVKEYTGPETLKKMKRIAKLYHGDEKDGVHKVVRANPDVLDTEVAFSREAEEDERPSVPRIDLACLEEVGGKILLRFWEAKLYSNPELRARGKEAPVVGQVQGYRDLVKKH